MSRGDLNCRLETLRLQPTDIVVLTCEERLTREQSNELATRLKEQLGGRQKVLVVSGGAKVQWLSKAELEYLIK
jgi:hypothetical protein